MSCMLRQPSPYSGLKHSPRLKKLFPRKKLTIRTASSSKGFHSTFDGKCTKTLALKERSKGEICKESPGQTKNDLRGLKMKGRFMI